jgi:hypothetical protein
VAPEIIIQKVKIIGRAHDVRAQMYIQITDTVLLLLNTVL